MGWDNIEGAAFLYYCSRGLALGLDSRGDALELVARFMRDKCKKTEEPRPIEDMKSVFEKNANFRNETGWDVPRTNRVILNLIATKKITWKKFLATLEFNPADEALLKDNSLLDIVEQTKRALDPPVTQTQQGREHKAQQGREHKAQQERENKSPLRPGGLTSIQTSLPEAYSSLLAPISTLGSVHGTGYSSSTKAAIRTGGVSGTSPYLPSGTEPGPLTGSSTKHHGAGALQLSPDPAFQRSGGSKSRSTIGQAASPPPPGYSTTDTIGEEIFDPQAQYPPTSDQTGQAPTVPKRPASEELEDTGIFPRKRKAKPDDDATIRARKKGENIAIARAELLEQSTKREIERQVRIGETAKKKEHEEAEERRKVNAEMARRLAAYQPYPGGRGGPQ